MIVVLKRVVVRKSVLLFEKLNGKVSKLDFLWLYVGFIDVGDVYWVFYCVVVEWFV